MRASDGHIPLADDLFFERLLRWYCIVVKCNAV